MITFDEVYRYSGALTSYLRGKLPPADAEDVLQDTFLQAFRGLDRYDPLKGSVYTWLLVILRGRLKTCYTKHKKRNEVSHVIELLDPVTPYDELELIEALTRMPAELTKKPSNGRERMRRYRARRKFIEEWVVR